MKSILMIGLGRFGRHMAQKLFTNKRTPTASRLPLEKVQIG